MSDPSTSWFHCGHCGSLFQAPLGRDVQRVCPSCGHEPSLGVNPIAVPENQNSVDAEERPDREGSKPSGERHKKRRRKKSAPMLILIVGWSLIMAGILFISNRYWKVPDKRPIADMPTKSQQTFRDEDVRMLNRYVAYCDAVVKNVVANSSPEAISPFVLQAPTTFADIARFYAMNPGMQILEPKLEREMMSIIRLPEGSAIEGRWKSEDGRRLEAVFRLEDGEMRIDWHHFVRFSDFPLALFLSGSGPDEAEFRLLARQRLTRMVLDDSDARPLSIEFYVPRFGNPGELGLASPPFDLDRNSEAAKMLLAAFEQSRSGQQPFDSLLAPMEADDEVIRVRVRIRRVQTEGERTFELVELLACHWLEHDDPGISTGVEPE